MAERTTPADVAAFPRGARTRFAPAPTGYLHLGHVANAIWVWGVAGATDGRVLLRIEDHDRERCRPEYDAALLEDLAWLGFVADEGPVRQSDDGAPYAAALERLRGEVLVYGCDCTRSTFAAWADEHGRRGRGPAARAAAGIAGWTARSCARRSAAARSAGWMRSSGRAPTRSPRAPATCRSAIATGTGRTASRSSSTTFARTSISWSAAATCSPRRRPRSGSAGCSGGRRPRSSPTTR